MKIAKYKLKLTQEQDIVMPQYAKIINAQIAKGELFMWAFIEVEQGVNVSGDAQFTPVIKPAVLVRRKIGIIKTNEPFFYYVGAHIATIQWDNQEFHLFDRGETICR